MPLSDYLDFEYNPNPTPTYSWDYQPGGQYYTPPTTTAPAPTTNRTTGTVQPTYYQGTVQQNALALRRQAEEAARLAEEAARRRAEEQARAMAEAQRRAEEMERQRQQEIARRQAEDERRRREAAARAEEMQRQADARRAALEEQAKAAAQRSPTNQQEYYQRQGQGDQTNFFYGRTAGVYTGDAGQTGPVYAYYNPAAAGERAINLNPPPIIPQPAWQPGQPYWQGTKPSEDEEGGILGWGPRLSQWLAQAGPNFANYLAQMGADFLSPYSSIEGRVFGPGAQFLQNPFAARTMNMFSPNYDPRQMVTPRAIGFGNVGFYAAPLDTRRMASGNMDPSAYKPRVLANPFGHTDIYAAPYDTRMKYENMYSPIYGVKMPAGNWPIPDYDYGGGWSWPDYGGGDGGGGDWDWPDYVAPEAIENWYEKMTQWRI